ncbi:hypothetical protein FRC12_009070 [Ceratobasidium sp. 428]|nr:hypothetical protein FRC12_009070 [Ceratobasidium sp. 428]
MTPDCAQTHLMFQRTTLEAVLVPPIGLRRPRAERTTRPLLTRAYSLMFAFVSMLPTTYRYQYSPHQDSCMHMPITVSLEDCLRELCSLYFAPVPIHSLTPTPTALVSACAPLAYNPTVGPWSARILRWVRILGCLRDQRNPDRRFGLDKTSHQFPTTQHVPGSTLTDAGRPSVRPVGLVFGFGGAVGHLVGAERQSERNDQ